MRIEEAKEGLRPLLAVVHKVALSSDDLATQSDVRITHEHVRALRNIMDGQRTEVQDFCPPSRRDTEQRVGDQGGLTSSSATVISQGFEEGSSTITRRGTWDAHD